MADTRILFVMINLTQSLQWESSWSIPDKIAFHSPLNFPAIFRFFMLCAELWSDWTYCVSGTAYKYGDCWSSLLLIAEHGGFVPKNEIFNISNKTTPIPTKWQTLLSWMLLQNKKVTKVFAEWQEKMSFCFFLVNKILTYFPAEQLYYLKINASNAFWRV